MKLKKMVGIVTVLLVVGTALAFAAGDRISFTDGSVTVFNTNNKGKITVEVCVTLKDTRGRTSDTTWTFKDIPAKRSSTQKAPGGTTVVGASSTYCSVPSDD